MFGLFIGEDDGGTGVAGAEGETAGRGREVKGEESQGEAEPGDQEGDGGREAEKGEDQAGEGKLD